MTIASKLVLAVAALAFTAGTAAAECNYSKMTTASKPAKPLTVATLTPPVLPAPSTSTTK